MIEKEIDLLKWRII